MRCGRLRKRVVEEDKVRKERREFKNQNNCKKCHEMLGVFYCPRH